jgi:hypothetical protein
LLTGAVKEGALDPATRFTTFGAGDGPDEGYLKFSVAGVDGAARERRAREESTAALAVLAKRLPSFRDVFLAEASRGVLDREGRRIVGEYVLTAEDVLAARKFPDGVVRNAWPIELWGREKGVAYRFIPPGSVQDTLPVPQGQGFSNMLVARLHLRHA